MTPTRPGYWNIEYGYLVWLFAAAALAIFGYGVYRHLRRWRQAKQPASIDHPLQRLGRVFTHAVLEARVVRDRYAGLMHLSFFWGFALLFAGTLVAMLDEDFGVGIMRGDFYLWFQSLVLDLAGLVAIMGFILALWRRHVIKPARISAESGGSQFVDLFIPWALLGILVTGFLIEGIRIQVTSDQWGDWSPVGYWVSLGFGATGISGASLRAIHVSLWWFHLTLATALIAFIPYSKLMHIVTAPLTIFFASLDTQVRPRPIDFEKAETLGVREAAQLRVKQLLDLDGCAECGRCQEACPAHAAGQPLSPKRLIQNLSRHVAATSTTSSAKSDDEDALPPLIAAADPDALWSCLTCQACMRECPVLVEHVPIVVDLRRYLVMERAEYPKQAQLALTNLEERGTPFRGIRLSRTDWCNDLDVPLLSNVGRAEYLFWVGCAGAFDERDQRIARAFVQLLRRAGVEFAILGDEERCTGDVARRLGHEYLFASCAEQNIAVLNGYGVQKIVTTCPHCYHTLKNDYPQFGGNYEVIHHTTLLAALIRERRLRLDSLPTDGSVTFHDPCYLGRYNGHYDEPRGLLRSIPGLKLSEMARSRDRSFCCGAGSGHMWIEEISGGRVNHLRVDQAIATGAGSIATACPFCTVMIEDGVRTRAGDVGPRVVEVAELLEEATRSEPPSR